jgi:4-nitrophenyl phosphatase
MKENGLEDKSKMIFVGDRLDTDIQLAINGGIDSLLVLSGVTDEKELSETEILPKYFIDDLEVLFNLLMME